MKYRVWAVVEYFSMADAICSRLKIENPASKPYISESEGEDWTIWYLN